MSNINIAHTVRWSLVLARANHSSKALDSLQLNKVPRESTSCARTIMPVQLQGLAVKLTFVYIFDSLACKISQFLVDPIMSKRATTSFPPGCNQTIAYSLVASNSSKGFSLNMHRAQNIWVTA
jgi:hypothetical protein